MTTNLHYLIAGMAVLWLFCGSILISGRWMTGTASCSAAC